MQEHCLVRDGMHQGWATSGLPMRTGAGTESWREQWWLGITWAWGCRRSQEIDAKMAGGSKIGGGAGRREDARRYRLECKGKGV
eukprot:SAG11_NODE_30578_length_299_cov_1.985000_1_plen_83_part_01